MADEEKIDETPEETPAETPVNDELEGNGGTESVEVEVVLRHWIFNPLNGFLGFAALAILVAAFLVRALLLHG